MAGLHGEYRHKLDAKGRLSLPAAFRKSLSGDSVVVTLSPTNDYLCVFEDGAFDSWVDSLFEKDGGYSASNRQHLKARKVLNSRANDIVIDGSGRIGLSSALRSGAGLDKDVVLIGDDDHFEIWDAQAWDDFCDDVDLTALFVG